jgi:hypothetical protein
MLTDKNQNQSYVGKVIQTFSKTERFMMDDYALFYYATVVEEDGSYKNVCLGNSEFGRDIEATVDASPEMIQAYEDHVDHLRVEREAEYAARMTQEAEERAQAEALEPVKGARVRVVKGRKVPKGTEGVVFWLGMDTYGMRLGLKDAEGQTHWTAASNVIRIVEDKLDSETWRDYLFRQRVSRPMKGNGVEILSSGQTGRVFYLDGDRLGVALTGRKDRSGRFADVVWTSTSEVKVISETFDLPEIEQPKVTVADRYPEVIDPPF